MPVFSYTARDSTGRLVKGTVVAENESEARARLRKMGLYVTSLSRAGVLKAPIGRRVSLTELALFTEELAAMLDSGLSLLRSVETLAQQVGNPRLRRALREIRSDLRRGMSLADALEEHPDIFSPFYVSIVRAGETSGALKEMLFRLAGYLESEADLKGKVRSALAYPTLVASFATMSVFFLTFFVVPRFSEVYAKMGAPLPLPTLLLVSLSRAAVKFWWAIVGALCIGSFAFLRWIKSKRGKMWFDRLKLKFPLVGELNRKATAARFLRVAASLIGSGIPVDETLRVMEELFRGNAVLSELVIKLRRSVIRGGRFAAVLAESDLFPPAALQIAATGEETGELGKMLDRSARFLERETEVAIRKMVNTITPLVTVILTVIVGFIVISVYLPMFEVMGRVRG
ncbi:hypothetical protein DRP77_05990 [Candidatus Poribacteria bacterium]|nr:MAG: hypothetical protein DRP77_05990 [Candidatus Poribacteria bacterium]